MIFYTFGVIDKKTPLKIYRKLKTEFESVYGVIGFSENGYKYFIVEIVRWKNGWKLIGLLIKILGFKVALKTTMTGKIPMKQFSENPIFNGA
jgi:hypothetical protein